MRSLAVLTLLVCLAQLPHFSRASLMDWLRPGDQGDKESQYKAGLEKLVGPAKEAYEDLVKLKAECPEWQLKKKLIAFRELHKFDELKKGPSFFLPGARHIVLMADLLEYEDKLKVACYDLPEREELIRDVKSQVSPTLHQYLKRTTEELSAFCETISAREVELFKVEEPEKWELIKELNKLVDEWELVEALSPKKSPSKQGVIEQPLRASREPLDGAMQELLKGKLSTGKYRREEIRGEARKLFLKVKDACSDFRRLDLDGAESVVNFNHPDLRDWLRYHRVCDQVVRANFTDTLERVERERIAQIPS